MRPKIAWDWEVIFNAIPDPVAIIDKDHRIVGANEAFANVFHATPEEFVGKACYEVVHRRDEPWPNCPHQRTMATKKPSVEEFVESSIGKYLRVSTSPLFDDSGELSGAVHIVHDITEYKKAEMEADEETEKLHAIISSAKDAVVLMEDEGKILIWNPAARKMFGYTIEEATGRKLNELIIPEQFHEAFETGLQRFKETGKGPKIGKTFELPALRKDGTEFPIELSISAFQLEGRWYALAMVRDITERRRLEEELRESQRHFRTLFNVTVDPVVIVDPGGTILEVTERAEEITGFRREELIGRRFMETGVVTDESKRVLMDRLAKRLRGVDSPPYEVEVVTRDGRKIPYEVNAQRIEYRGTPAVMAAFRDITERKKAEERIKGLLQQLEERNRMLEQSNIDLEKYTYTVSHDLKAPLRTIAVFSRFLMEEYSSLLDEKGRDYLERIERAAAHMDELIDDLLRLSRVGRKFKEIAEVDLNDLLASILSDLKPSIERRNAEVVVHSLPVIPVQRIWIRELFTNLIDNGLKFNESETPRVEVMCEERSSDYLFKVRDNGIGIEKQYHERIFNLFERLHTKEEYEGTGAGLAICRKIVENFGGEIWVESTPGKGSTFFFTIPKKKNQEDS